MKLVWAILPGLALFADAITFTTETKCCVLNGDPLCPGEVRVIKSDFATIMAGFPPNSKSVAEWAPKWYETVYLPPTVNKWPYWKLNDFALADDQCVYARLGINPWYPIKCLNYKYTYGDKVSNPWHALDYGPDGPIDYSDPQHFSGDPNSWANTRSYNNPEYDPEGKLRSNDARDNSPEPLRSFIHNTGADLGPGPDPPPNIAWPVPQNPPPRPVSPSSAIDEPEKDASAGSADSDHSLFSNAIADGGTFTNGVLDGASDGNGAATGLTASLDKSLFDNAGNSNNIFDASTQGDLTAFGLDSTSSNLASVGGGGFSDDNDWTSSLSPGEINFFTADNNVGGSTTPYDDLFTANNDAGTITTTDDLFIADNTLAGSTNGDDNLFAKRSRKNSARDFRL